MAVMSASSNLVTSPSHTEYGAIASSNILLGTCILSLSFLLNKVGEAGEAKSFLVEITWGELYPDELPTISLDAFFNNHL